MRRRRYGLRLTALAVAVGASLGCCVRLAGAQLAADGAAGLLGLTFVSAPEAAARTLAQWMTDQAAEAPPAGGSTAVLGPADPDDAPARPADGQTGAAGGQHGLSGQNGLSNQTGQTGQTVQSGEDGTGADDAQNAQDAAAPGSPAEGPTADEVADNGAAVSHEGWLPVRETFYPDTGEGERYLPLAAGSVRNLTDYSAGQVREVLDAGGLPFAVELYSDQPQVLIMHTHTTECYAEADGLVSPDNNGRTTDTAANMAAVGAVLADTLNAAGICTVQDTTLHDYPSYNGSYGRSRATVEEWLAACPSIRVVLDVHRDAIENDGVRVKPTAVINGQKAAQLMIICGADDGTMEMPNFWQNLRFAAALEEAIESRYDGLTRPVLFDYRNYNQQLTTGSLLLEFGSHGSTLEEARYTASLVGQALAALLKGE